VPKASARLVKTRAKPSAIGQKDDGSVFTYPAVRLRQTPNGPWLIMFGAPATEIDAWSGVPQKKAEKDEEETLGFQRDENKQRIEQLVEFYRSPENIIQNPLLLATRGLKSGAVRFVQTGYSTPDAEYGTVHITIDQWEARLLVDLIREVKDDLEKRVPSLKARDVDMSLVDSIKRRTRILPTDAVVHAEADEADEDADQEEQGEEDVTDAAGAVFSDESHVVDFWDELSARIYILEEMRKTYKADEFSGVTKDAMIAFLKPVLVVDGQHRLRGATKAAREEANKPEYRKKVEAAINAGQSHFPVQRRIESEVSRRLPVCLLQADDPAEHVFQFVVVNQKATPLKRSLLGTIVSTTLSNQEAERVSVRLERAGIRMEESRAIASLIRDPKSPFYKLVERGLPSDAEDLLQWTVFGSLVKIFQRLEGARLFGKKNDYARIWRDKCLDDCAVVAKWESHKSKCAFDYWRELRGPWRAVFISFWNAVREHLAVQNSEEAFNYWGRPRTSNLFNKISLTILAADFFQYMSITRTTIAQIDDIPKVVNQWLEGVSASYFARDWNLSGVKKDAPGIRKQWALIWQNYRESPDKLPSVSQYRKAAE
jgi:hypothetical protein